MVAGSVVFTVLGCVPYLNATGQVPELKSRSPVKVLEAGTGTEPLDLNTASVTQLRQLPGMGSAYVRRIVEGRHTLQKTSF